MKPYRDAQAAARNAITIINMAKTIGRVAGAVNAILNPEPSAPQTQTISQGDPDFFAPTDWEESKKALSSINERSGLLKYFSPYYNAENIMGFADNVSAVATWLWNRGSHIVDPPETTEEFLTRPKNVGYDLSGREIYGDALWRAKAEVVPFVIAPAVRGIASGVSVLTQWSPVTSATLGTAIGLTNKIPSWAGSGPTSRVIGINSNSLSNKALLNYYPKSGGIEYIFDTESGTLLVGNASPKLFSNLSPHMRLALSIEAEGPKVVGGIFKRGPNGSFIFNENSGHFGEFWNAEFRSLFQTTMNQYGIPAQHVPWGF